MSKLTAQALTKSYGKKEVLYNIDLTLESGKIYGLIGRNGAGKTTLLSILTAQNPATSGTITLDGQPVWENPEVLSQLCFSRELTPSNGSGLAAMKIKEYLKIASTFYPYWDKEMADNLVQNLSGHGRYSMDFLHCWYLRSYLFCLEHYGCILEKLPV